MLSFVEKNIENIVPEDVDAYSASIMGRLIRWIQAAVKLRRSDVIRRKALHRRAKELREEAISKEAKRVERQNLETSEAENKFNEDHKDEI